MVTNGYGALAIPVLFKQKKESWLFNSTSERFEPGQIALADLQRYLGRASDAREMP